MANNIFGGSSQKDQEQVKDQVDTHSKAILTVTQRQKDLESSLSLLSEKLELLDHNSVKNFRKVNQDLKDLRDELRDIKSEIQNIKEFNSKMAKQIKLMGTRDEIAKLEKYIDFWEPMKFITRDELEDFRKKVKNDLQEIVEGFITEEKTKKKK